MSASSQLPLVVQLGFSGSRHFLPASWQPASEKKRRFHKLIKERLTERLATLPKDLRLSPNHFLCGISQIAIGADTLFTLACRTLGIPQRIFLPQHREEYLNATGSRGADFSHEEIATAHELLGSPHIIQERVVSDAPDRTNRFHDAQLELLRVSDVLVCLLLDDATEAPEDPRGLAPGTAGLLELAKKNGRPVLEIRVDVQGESPAFHETWHHLDRFRIPGLPQELSGVPFDSKPGALPDIAEYVSALKSSGSRIADSQRNLFKNAALVIIAAHLFATICALGALIFHADIAFYSLLGVELLCLGASYTVHHHLHHSHACQIWAVSRVVAEISRSVQAITDHHLYLSHLFQLPFPKPLRSLLRTLNVLHLRSSSRHSRENWKHRRENYVRIRLTDAHGQIRYNRITRDKATRQLKLAHQTFLVCSIAAIASTFTKLAGHHFFEAHHLHWASSLLGALAIILPVLAVGALSLAAAFDLEARHNTSDEILTDLADLQKALENATSEREFSRLLLETESRLLGETANWFARRSFTGVA